MKTTWFSALLVAGCLGSSAAQAQTARIAYLSHGGSLAAGAVADLDNFGLYLPRPVFRADTIVATSDSTAVLHGTTSSSDEPAKRARRDIYYGKHYYQQAAATGPQSRAAAVKLLQQRYPEAKLVGFDTAAVAPAAMQATKLKKEKTKRKRHQEAGLNGAPPTVPPHTGVWVALATIIGLGAAGLLLGDKRRAVPAATT